MVKNVIFDLGGVLIDWDPKYLYKKIFKDPKEMDSFLKEVCNSEWNIQQDAGRSWTDAIKERVAKFPHYEKEINAYFQRWTEMLGGPIEESVEIFRGVLGQGNLNVFALTNWSSETFTHATERYGFLSEFHGIIVSGEVKMIKPDPAIFHHLASTFSIKLNESLFIDDNKANVLSAKRLGMRGIHFQSPQQLKEELKTLNLH